MRIIIIILIIFSCISVNAQVKEVLSINIPKDFATKNKEGLYGWCKSNGMVYLKICEFHHYEIGKIRDLIDDKGLFRIPRVPVHNCKMYKIQ